MKKPETKSENIDPRIVDILREYVNDLKSEIKSEINKASLILGFQGTILFIISTKITSITELYPKIILIILFLISAFVSFKVILTGKVIHINVFDRIDFERGIILKQIKENYKELKNILDKKIYLNKINMSLQGLILGIMLIYLFFFV